MLQATWLVTVVRSLLACVSSGNFSSQLLSYSLLDMLEFHPVYGLLSIQETETQGDFMKISGALFL